MSMVENFRFDRHRRNNVEGSDESDESWQSDYTQEDDELSDSDIEPTEEEKKQARHAPRGHGHGHNTKTDASGHDKPKKPDLGGKGGIKILKRKEPRQEASNEGPKGSQREGQSRNQGPKGGESGGAKTADRDDFSRKNRRKERGKKNRDNYEHEDGGEDNNAIQEGKKAKKRNNRRRGEKFNDEEGAGGVNPGKKTGGSGADQGKAKEKHRPKYVPKGEQQHEDGESARSEVEEGKKPSGGAGNSESKRDRQRNKNKGPQQTKGGGDERGETASTEGTSTTASEDKKWKKKRNRNREDRKTGSKYQGQQGDDEKSSLSSGKQEDGAEQGHGGQKKWRPKGETATSAAAGKEGPRWRVKGQENTAAPSGSTSSREEGRQRPNRKDEKKEFLKDKKKAEKWDKRTNGRKWEPVKENKEGGKQNGGQMKYNPKTKQFIPGNGGNAQNAQSFSVHSKTFIPQYGHSETQHGQQEYEDLQYIAQGYGIEQGGEYIEYGDPAMGTVVMDPNWNQHSQEYGMEENVGYDDYSQSIWQYDPTGGAMASSEYEAGYEMSHNGIVEAIATSGMEDPSSYATHQSADGGDRGGFNVESPSFDPNHHRADSSKFVGVSSDDPSAEKLNVNSNEFFPKSKDEFA